MNRSMLGEEEIKSVSDYLNIIKHYTALKKQEGNMEDFVFRGQGGDHPLIPKIGRLSPKSDLLHTERQLLEEFKRTNPLLISAHKPYDDWDYLTLGQHFGLPTRFLDWSNNALTALWFATRENNNQELSSAYAVVWVLMAETADFDLNISNEHPFEVSETKIFRPRIIKQRINNQSGVFSIQPSADIQQKKELDLSDGFSQKLLKITIPGNQFKEIGADLHMLGVNAFTIFPELEGLCSYLQWRYFD